MNNMSKVPLKGDKAKNSENIFFMRWIFFIGHLWYAEKICAIVA